MSLRREARDLQLLRGELVDRLGGPFTGPLAGRLQLDARALGVVRTVAFDAACLRGKCEQDAQLGYTLMQRFAAVMVERLQATRLRLLDVYGRVPAR